MSINRFITFIKKEVVNTVDLIQCHGCGKQFVPALQIEKLHYEDKQKFLCLCDNCKRIEWKNILMNPVNGKDSNAL